MGFRRPSRGRTWPRLGTSVAACLALLLGSAPVDAAAVPVSPAAAAVDPTTLADPFTGTGGVAPWYSGNTTPAAARPFGMVQLGPDTTRDDVTGRPSTNASGYSAGDGLLRGFSPTHLSGAGCPAFGDVPLLPWTGAAPDDPASATVPLDHGTERAGPGWYRSTLGNDVSVALTAGLRSGLVSFSFPPDRRARVLVKAAGSLAGVRQARVVFLNRREVAVSATSGGFCGSPSSYRVHVLVRFEEPVRRRSTWGGGSAEDLDVRGRNVGASAVFAPGVGRVRARIGVSFVSPEGARRNLEADRLGWSYAAARDTALTVWRRELGRIAVTAGGTDAERRGFATALYHVLLSPMTVSDADRRYRGFDGRVRTLPRGGRQYSAIPGWDAYRTSFPLLAWVRPDVASDVVASLQRDALEGGWLPRWPLVASYTGVMNGDSAAPLVASAYAFGARDWSLPLAVRQLVAQADEPDPGPGQGWFRPRPGLAAYLERGYVPNTTPERGWPQPHGASTTLEYAVDDFAVSRLARAAGRPGVADRFLRRSGGWRTLLDAGRGLLLPRDASGAFPGAGYDPARCCDGYQEGNATQYTWAVPQDMAGLLAGLGARADVLQRLDDFHQSLNVGAGSPHAWLGNQPSFATPWAYLWLGRPARTAEVVAAARSQLWSPGPGGLRGNDDLGSLSAWYVWSALGLYPLTPGTPNVGITPPAFSDVAVRPSTGDVTRIVRRGSGAYVSGLLVDGAPRSASWLSLGPAARPARIEVRTAETADPAWGTAPSDAPPAYPPPR